MQPSNSHSLLVNQFVHKNLSQAFLMKVYDVACLIVEAAMSHQSRNEYLLQIEISLTNKAQKHSNSTYRKPSIPIFFIIIKKVEVLMVCKRTEYKVKY